MSDATEDAPGTLIRVDHGDRRTWHHSVTFDGYTHGTACGLEVECDEFDELLREISEWTGLETEQCCDECAGSVRSLLPDEPETGEIDPEEAERLLYEAIMRIDEVRADYPRLTDELDATLSQSRMGISLTYFRIGREESTPSLTEIAEEAGNDEFRRAVPTDGGDRGV